MPIGDHTLQLNGLTKSLEVRTASIPVVVQPKIATPTKPTVPVAPVPILKPYKVSFSVNFNLNSWWVTSAGYRAIGAAVKKVPVEAQNVKILIVGSSQKTAVDPYPNIGLDRAKAVAKAMRTLGFVGRYNVSQVDKKVLSTPEARRAVVTISWSAP